MNTPKPSAAPGPLAVRAFTLIELLTVIAVVGILAAILIPTVGAVRASARESSSRSNLRQIAVATTLYAGENQGRLPSLYVASTNLSFRDFVAPFLQTSSKNDTKGIFISPAAPQPVEENNDWPTTYNVNFLVIGTPVFGPSTGAGKLINVVRPRRVVMIGEGAQLPSDGNRSRAYFWNSGYFNSSFLNAVDLATPVPPEQLFHTAEAEEAGVSGGFELFVARRGGAINVAMVDGGVQALKTSEVTWGHLIPSR